MSNSIVVMSGIQEATQWLRYHGANMERTDAEREAAVSMLVVRIAAATDDGVNSLMNAISYLRGGDVPLSFNLASEERE